MSFRELGGFIDETGAIISQYGEFDITRDLNGGVFTIAFHRPFLAPPVVVATQVHNNDPTFNMTDTKDNCVFLKIDNQGFKVKTGDSVGIGSWRKFSFIAVGFQVDE
eukprot:TRINITY_DN1470_c1_g1_i3.p2 TRINITY_DN1470_c1_g1~~TRINITY_DN1470_c1_g1_i3.p2  ORF type:complete len:107 (-),score=20.06 TRINITY_DN1470_c1_g1_i3:236-556(-)